MNANGTLQLDSVAFVIDECTRLIRNNYVSPNATTWTKIKTKNLRGNE